MKTVKLAAVVVAGLWSGSVLAQESKAPAAQKQAYGKPFTVATPATPIAEVLANPEKFEGKTVKLTGTVSQVCQAKGCWVMLDAGNGAGIRVKTAHQFFLPKDARGTAVVHGEFKAVELSEAQAAHFAEDGNTAARPGKEWQIVATSIVVSP